ncbi:hypothetical protein JS756_12235 [Streptomyces actuosus]|uniref:Uncharacterized protein n=1 Tax=Streptomyces actuosus TaxID=1885 RepID=A0ABS2VP23_STRAS|nr:hypothetical protein [Streptomyces actuosus]MBN0044863.1 hypothetical protein [Streptomyces actuosus]
MAQGGLDAALNSSHQRARADDPDYLASCLINRFDTGRHGGALTIRLRWSNQSATLATLAPLAPLGRNANGVEGQAAPLGSGWPGVIRYDGPAQVVVALECQNAKETRPCWHTATSSAGPRTPRRPPPSSPDSAE